MMLASEQCEYQNPFAVKVVADKGVAGRVLLGSNPRTRRAPTPRRHVTKAARKNHDKGRQRSSNRQVLPIDSPFANPLTSFARKNGRQQSYQDPKLTRPGRPWDFGNDTSS